MADLQDAAHFDAALNLLRADATLRLYPDGEGFVPTLPVLPYIRVHHYISRQPDAPGNSLAGLSHSWTVWLYFHCAGETDQSAAAMQMRVRAGLLDVVPTVAGRVCGPLREDQCLPVQKDSTSGRDVYDAVCIYRYTSN